MGVDAQDRCCARGVMIRKPTQFGTVRPEPGGDDPTSRTLAGMDDLWREEELAKQQQLQEEDTKGPPPLQRRMTEPARLQSNTDGVERTTSEGSDAADTVAGAEFISLLAGPDKVEHDAKYYIREYGLAVEDDVIVQFKNYQGPDRVDRINKDLSKFVTGFLNAKGGALLFGISGDGTVVGTLLDRGERRRVREKIDQIICGVKPSCQHLCTSKFVKICEREKLALMARILPNVYVIKITIQQGRILEIYEYDTRAYQKRDRSCVLMTPQMIAAKLRLDAKQLKTSQALD